MLQNCPNCGAVNSANAKTCYVCVSTLAGAQSESLLASKRRYTSFPDEVSSESQAAEAATGAAIARDLLKNIQRKAKPRRAPATKPTEEHVVAASVLVEDAPHAGADAVSQFTAAPEPLSESEELLSPVSVEEPADSIIDAATLPLAASAAERKTKVTLCGQLATPEPPPIADEPPAAGNAPADAIEAALQECARQIQELRMQITEPAAVAEEEHFPSASVNEAEESVRRELEPVAVLASSLPEEAAAHETAPVSSGRTADTREASPTLRGVRPTVLASEDWRRELSDRVEAYRTRTGGAAGEDESQSGLAFDPASEAAPAADMEDVPLEAPSPRAGLRLAARGRPVEPIEIVALQPEFDFASGETDEHPHAPLVPVADLGERRIAGLLDATFLVASYLAFLVYFSSLGGKISFGKMELAIYGIIFFLFYVQYFGLFTLFSGITPGMMIRGLRVVSFDGTLPDSHRLMQRGLGYLVSFGALMIGFLWSVWDEDQLTWHDRMSHTYLTHADPQPRAE